VLGLDAIVLPETKQLQNKSPFLRVLTGVAVLKLLGTEKQLNLSLDKNI
jgi:hypothetical protein